MSNVVRIYPPVTRADPANFAGGSAQDVIFLQTIL